MSRKSTSGLRPVRLDELEWRDFARADVGKGAYFAANGREWVILHMRNGTYTLGPKGGPWTHVNVCPLEAQCRLYELQKGHEYTRHQHARTAAGS